jgi:hypothetical protein
MNVMNLLVAEVQRHRLINLLKITKSKQVIRMNKLLFYHCLYVFYFMFIVYFLGEIIKIPLKCLHLILTFTVSTPQKVLKTDFSNLCLIVIGN